MFANRLSKVRLGATSGDEPPLFSLQLCDSDPCEAASGASATEEAVDPLLVSKEEGEFEEVDVKEEPGPPWRTDVETGSSRSHDDVPPEVGLSRRIKRERSEESLPPHDGEGDVRSLRWEAGSVETVYTVSVRAGSKAFVTSDDRDPLGDVGSSGRTDASCLGGDVANRPRSSTTGPGPSATRPGSSTIRPGPSATRPGSSTTRPGPSTTRPGSSTTRPGPSTTRPRSARIRARTQTNVTESPEGRVWNPAPRTECLSVQTRRFPLSDDDDDEGFKGFDVSPFPSSDEDDAPATGTRSDRRLFELRCRTCGATFGRRDLLEKHSKAGCSRSRDDEPYRCETCSSVFIFYYKFREHSKRCVAETRSSDRIAGRVAAKVRKKVFRCGRCNDKFDSDVDLDRHARFDCGKDFHCTKCNSNFLHKRGLYQHRKRECRKMFRCDECNRGYMYETSLWRHTRTKHRHLPTTQERDQRRQSRVDVEACPAAHVRTGPERAPEVSTRRPDRESEETVEDGVDRRLDVDVKQEWDEVPERSDLDGAYECGGVLVKSEFACHSCFKGFEDEEGWDTHVKDGCWNVGIAMPGCEIDVAPRSSPAPTTTIAGLNPTAENDVLSGSSPSFVSNLTTTTSLNHMRINPDIEQSSNFCPLRASSDVTNSLSSPDLTPVVSPNFNSRPDIKPSEIVSPKPEFLPSDTRSPAVTKELVSVGSTDITVRASPVVDARSTLGSDLSESSSSPGPTPDACARTRPSPMVLHETNSCKEKWLCSTCGKMFVRRAELDEHQRDVCGGERTTRGKTSVLPAASDGRAKEGRRDECTNCGKGFRNAFLRRTHSRTECGRGWLCPVCAQVFTRRPAYRQHVYECAGATPCRTCDAAFPKDPDSDRLVCRDCGSRPGHVPRFDADEDLTCSDCGASFPTKTIFDRHRDRGCSKLLGLLCSKCNKVFISVSLWNSHITYKCRLNKQKENVTAFIQKAVSHGKL